ncbi:MAG: type II toxin-antitoxin system HipA family toxin [Pyrinomonadaceae bacterium]
MTIASVRLWGTEIGAVSWDGGNRTAAFEYTRSFQTSGIEVSPLSMPLSERIYSFPALGFEAFSGLPGLLADSLPDSYGNALIDAWLARQGRASESFNPVERLCYTGSRGMGALEFVPSTGPVAASSEAVDVNALVELASEILSKRSEIKGSLDDDSREATLRDILRVGTSAGGARAKAIIAWNPETGEVRSGQVDAGKGFGYWLLKFDGVSGNRDRELDDPAGFGLVEYAYHKMALAAGISMNECRVLEENGRHHFLTKRFDRTPTGEKIHMQSLGALAHFDYNRPGAYSYEQAIAVIKRLGMGMSQIEEQFRRMAFNIIARNQDDHVKNIAFLMDRRGIWSLAPAFDLTYSYNPNGDWTSRHQMTLNGKREDFTIADFESCARAVSMKRGRAAEIVREVIGAVSNWNEFAKKAGVGKTMRDRIGKAHRLKF